jgi:hypothetical protein
MANKVKKSKIKVWCGLCIMKYYIKHIVDFSSCNITDIAEENSHAITNMVNDHEETLIICIPLSYSKAPPKDQINCVIEKCPKCKKEMWVSEKKRNIRDNVAENI